MFVFILMSSLSYAAITYDSSTGDNQAGGASLTYSATAPTCDSGVILVTSAVEVSETTSSVTYGGDAMTLVLEESFNYSANHVSLWYKLAPKTGANDVVVTYSASMDRGASIAAFYCGVDAIGNDCQSDDAACAITTAEDDSWVVSVISDVSAKTFGVASDLTDLRRTENYSSTLGSALGDGDAGTAGTFSAAWTGASNYGVVSVEIQEATVSTPTEVENIFDCEANIIFTEDFTGSDVYAMGFDASGNSNAFIANGTSIYMTLDRDVDDPEYRTEVVSNNLTGSYFDDVKYYKIGEEYWFKIKSYLPADWVYDSTYEIITQFHGVPDATEANRNPMLALHIRDGTAGDGYTYIFKIRADSNALFDGNYTVNRQYDLGSITDDRGAWVEWIYKIKWAYDNTGEFTLWKDGVKVVEELNQGNCYNDDVGPYHKFGIYKPPWNPASGDYVAGDTGTGDRSIYYDDMEISVTNDVGFWWSNVCNNDEAPPVFVSGANLTGVTFE